MSKAIDARFEVGARAYCAARGMDADRPAWMDIAEMLQEQERHQAGLTAAIHAMGCYERESR
jgi:hypothetical protein